jgi:hypothetical protein
MSFGIKIPVSTTPRVLFKVFEDKVGAIELVKAPKLCPQMKHITIQYHYFCIYMHFAKKLIDIQYPLTMMEQVSCGHWDKSWCC